MNQLSLHYRFRRLAAVISSPNKLRACGFRCNHPEWGVLALNNFLKNLRSSGSCTWEVLLAWHGVSMAAALGLAVWTPFSSGIQAEWRRKGGERKLCRRSWRASGTSRCFRRDPPQLTPMLRSLEDQGPSFLLRSAFGT
jgi:hypothetical protein